MLLKLRLFMMLEMSDVRDDARFLGVRGFWGVGLTVPFTNKHMLAFIGDFTQSRRAECV
jgi:hypothetical protein